MENRFVGLACPARSRGAFRRFSTPKLRALIYCHRSLHYSGKTSEQIGEPGCRGEFDPLSCKCTSAGQLSVAPRARLPFLSTNPHWSTVVREEHLCSTTDWPQKAWAHPFRQRVSKRVFSHICITISGCKISAKKARGNKHVLMWYRRAKWFRHS